MTGEMSQSEVTQEAYPGLFALQRALRRRGIASTPRAFDQYAGPVLRVPGYPGVSVWYSPDEDQTPERPLFQIEDGARVYQADTATYTPFQVDGAHHVHTFTDESYAAGCYTLRQAAKRIAALIR